MEYSKVDNPYEHVLVKNTYAKGENIANTKNIIVETGSASKIYDGKPLSNYSLSLVSEELNDGDKLVDDSTKHVSIIYAASVNNVLTPKIIDSTTGEDHTSNYNITINYGTLTVDKRPVTLTSQSFSYSSSFPYFGDNTVSISGMGFVDGDIALVESRYNTFNRIPGTYENKPIVVMYKKPATFSSDVVANSYDITYNYGTIRIL